MRLILILAVLLVFLSPAHADLLSEFELYLKSERGQRNDFNVLLRDPEWIDAESNPRFGEAVLELKARNFGEASGMLRPLSEEGHAKAQLLLGVILYWGIGVEKNVADGMHWVKQAADQGLPAAEVQLISLYLNDGHDDLATRLLHQTAEQGLIYAQITLGVYYDMGVAGLPRDGSKAFEWFLKAADAGEPFAMGQVAERSYVGMGVKPDIVEAVRWAHAAADLDEPLGQFVLGNIYTEAFRDNRWTDLEKGVAWYRRAAEQGYRRAQRELAGFYGSGYGIPRDLVAAYMWAILADMELSSLASELTAEQIAEGEKRAHEWLERRGLTRP